MYVHFKELRLENLLKNNVDCVKDIIAEYDEMRQSNDKVELLIYIDCSKYFI